MELKRRVGFSRRGIRSTFGEANRLSECQARTLFNLKLATRQFPNKIGAAMKTDLYDVAIIGRGPSPRLSLVSKKEEAPVPAETAGVMS